MIGFMNRTRTVTLAIAFLYLIGFLFLARYDYSFSAYLTSHASAAFILAGARLGPLPAMIVTAYAIFVLSNYREWYRVYHVAGLGVLAFAAFSIIKPDLSSLSEILLVIVIWFVLFLIVRALPQPEFTLRNERILQFGIVITAGSAFAVQVLKLLWGRPRFYALNLYDLAFVPWYRIAGFAWRPDAFRSFPSGHTNGAAAVFFLVFLPVLFPDRFRRKWIWWVICSGYTALVGLTRIMAGMHYISDVMGGCFLYLLAFAAGAAVLERKNIGLFRNREEGGESNGHEIQKQ